MRESQFPQMPGVEMGPIVRAGGALMAVRRFGEGFGVRNMRRSFARFGIVVRGRGWMRINGEHAVYARGMTLFRPAELPVCSQLETDSVDEFIVLLFDCDGPASPARVHPVASACVYQLFVEHTDSDLCASLSRESLVAELRSRLGEDLGAADPRAPWLARAAERLRDCGETPPTLDQLACDAGVHFTHFARAFRKRYRLTPGDYARRWRLNRAARELVDSDKPLTLISLDHGFCDQSHFGRHFKRAFGVTPRRFRAAFGEPRVSGLLSN